MRGTKTTGESEGHGALPDGRDCAPSSRVGDGKQGVGGEGGLASGMVGNLPY